MKDLGYKDLKDYQIQALVDFVYNLGLGKLRALTETGKRSIKEISEMIPAYCKAKNKDGELKPLPGLIKRRAWEKDLFDGKLEKEEIKAAKNPTAKDLQKLVNDVSGSDLVIDGKIGKKTIAATYKYIAEVSSHE